MIGKWSESNWSSRRRVYRKEEKFERMKSIRDACLPIFVSFRKVGSAWFEDVGERRSDCEILLRSVSLVFEFV